MKIRVVVNGAQGKMGSLACETLRSHTDFQLVASTGRGDFLEQVIQETHAAVVVDLTRADCVYDNALTIIKSGAHPVIGTSGLLDEQMKMLSQLCQDQGLGGLVVPNFSIAACLMMRFAAHAATVLPDVEIIEAHHPQKLDTPSGTALKTAEMIANVRQDKRNRPPLKEIIPGARGAEHHQVNIHSLRLPGILARQQVIFGNTGETLTLTHESIDRASFMPGLVLACQRVLELNTLHYGLEHILFPSG